MDVPEETVADVNGRLHVIMSAAIAQDMDVVGHALDAFEQAYGRSGMRVVACGFGEYARQAVRVIADREGIANPEVLPRIDERSSPHVVFACRFLAAWCSGDEETAHALYVALESWPEDQWGEGLATLGVLAAQVMRAAYGEVL